MFFNQPLAEKSANGSLWCGEIHEKARAFLFQTNESSVALSPSLSTFLSLLLFLLYLLTLICSTDYCCISSRRRSFLPSSSLSMPRPDLLHASPPTEDG